ncbi:MAG: mannose-6-phosphate isomerase, class I [Treponema sp.]|nr:mannose-6-phosphate isomerase, class I [Treponema sp.]
MMNKIYKLNNQIKHYDWGSKEILPQFLGVNNNEGTPYAELWMGTHNAAPSQIELNTELKNLNELSGELPFLFKLLAVEKPLSIQVHPNKEQAINGFIQENESGLDINSPERKYKDKNHKSEILCAITPFTLMAGFKKQEDITASLAVLTDDQKKLIKYFETLYPEDNAVYTPLYFNIITLQPYQAVFLPAGVPHAYLSGFGVELMNNSDNVLRGGLSSKYIDINEFMKIVKRDPFMPEIITPDLQSKYSFSLPGEDFLLSIIHGNGEVILSEQGSVICIITEGELVSDGLTFKKGESFFIPKDTEQLILKGNFILFMASELSISERSKTRIHAK